MMTGTPQADLLFDNGPVFTGDGASGPVCQPVAVGDGRILAVGPRARDLASWLRAPIGAARREQLGPEIDRLLRWLDRTAALG